jgi:hypothetical protein
MAPDSPGGDESSDATSLRAPRFLGAFVQKHELSVGANCHGQNVIFAREIALEFSSRRQPAAVA